VKIERRRVASATVTGNTINGYAVRFNERSRPLPMQSAGPDGLFVETISPAAFDRSLASERSISLFWNHDMAALPLATTRGGLTLEADDEGIAFSATLANTNQADDVRALLDSGDLDGSMSFGFVARSDEWKDDEETKYPQRRVLSADLIEVSLVDVGAYPNAKASKSPRRERAARILECVQNERF